MGVWFQVFRKLEDHGIMIIQYRLYLQLFNLSDLLFGDSRFRFGNDNLLPPFQQSSSEQRP